MDIQHLQVHVSGTVQGVGFRPFIYHLARKFNLLGTVQNNSKGVLIHIEGSQEHLHQFLESIVREAPTAAQVNRLTETELPLANFSDFRILQSEVLEDAFTQVSPDIALCADCRRELEDARDRRYGYPFINCTNCGPRFTIIEDVPYDRPLTTMSPFEMCQRCRAEYDNPADRRFHAQPVACHECGPKLQFLTNAKHGWQPVGNSDNALSQTVEALKSRQIVLLQGIGGFHLACDACDDELVQKLRRRKHRDEKPCALMFPGTESLREHCEVSDR
ncbi:MAG: acylphosphatase, partial [bacterium]